MKEKKEYSCADYESDKKLIEGQNLTPEEYEAKIKEMAKRNGF